MSELTDFEYFRDHQVHYIDFTTGRIDTKSPNINRIFYDVGSINPDGYVRIWCNGNLRMKHRLIYFLFHGVLPDKGEEIDHYDGIRDNNKISNLRVLSKSLNNSTCINRKIGRRSVHQIRLICEYLQDTDVSDEGIANIVGYVTRATVRDIKTRRSRKAIGNQYHWPHRGY